MPEINYLAVLVAGVVAQVLGALWYGPIFGKQWLLGMGWGPEKVQEAKERGGMWKLYLGSFLSALVVSYVTAHVYWAWELAAPEFATQPLILGAMVGFFSWLGFSITSTVSSVIWEERNMTVFGIGAGHDLVRLIVVGVIIGLM